MKKLLCMLVVVVACMSSFVSSVRANDDYEVIFIPKLIGIPWYSSMEEGMKEYAEKLGGITVSVSGAPDPDPVQQARIVLDAISKQPDCIIVVPNDPNTLEAILQKAQKAGIDILTQEAANIKNATADVEFIINDKVGKQYIDALVEAQGDKGGYAIMVGGLTNESHNARADAIVKYQKENYPELYEVSERLEGAESVPIAHDKTLELIKAHGDDLKGVLYIGTLGPIGGANAIEEKDLIGKVAIIGTATPSQAKDYLARGSITTCIISNNPAKIGMAQLDVADKLFRKGMKIEDITEVPVFGKVVREGKALYFHAEDICTAENADEFGF